MTQTRDNRSVHPLFSMLIVRLFLPARVSLATAPGHPIGIPLASAAIVGAFLAILGLMMGVGHLRERRRHR